MWSPSQPSSLLGPDGNDPSDYLDSLKRHPSLTGKKGCPVAGQNGCWQCTNVECNNVNFPRRRYCHCCGLARDIGGTLVVAQYVQALKEGEGMGGEDPSDYLNRLGRHPSLSGVKGGPKVGVDGCWQCELGSCRGINFPRRKECHSCGAPRGPEGTAIVAEYVRRVKAQCEAQGSGTSVPVKKNGASRHVKANINLYNTSPYGNKDSSPQRDMARMNKPPTYQEDDASEDRYDEEAGLYQMRRSPEFREGYSPYEKFGSAPPPGYDRGLLSASRFRHRAVSDSRTHQPFNFFPHDGREGVATLRSVADEREMESLSSDFNKYASFRGHPGMVDHSNNKFRGRTVSSPAVINPELRMLGMPFQTEVGFAPYPLAGVDGSHGPSLPRRTSWLDNMPPPISRTESATKVANFLDMGSLFDRTASGSSGGSTSTGLSGLSTPLVDRPDVLFVSGPDGKLMMPSSLEPAKPFSFSAASSIWTPAALNNGSDVTEDNVSSSVEGFKFR